MQRRAERIDWLYTHGLGLGGVTPGARATKFNGAPVREKRPFDVSPGLAWVSNRHIAAHGPVPGFPLNVQGVFSSIGNWIGGRHHSTLVATIDPDRVDDAIFIARSMLAPTAPPDRGEGPGLREWALARWCENGVVGSGVHFRGWSKDAEDEFKRRLVEHAGMELLLWCSKGDRAIAEPADPAQPYAAPYFTPLHVSAPFATTDVEVLGEARVTGVELHESFEADRVHVLLGW